MSICHGCGGVIGRDCFNPQECEQITRSMASEFQTQPDYSSQIHSLEKLLAELTIDNQRLQGDFSKWTKEQIEEQNQHDLKEMAHWYGGWNELRTIIAQLEYNDNEAAFERSMNKY